VEAAALLLDAVVVGLAAFEKWLGWLVGFGCAEDRVLTSTVVSPSCACALAMGPRPVVTSWAAVNFTTPQGPA